MAEEKIVNRDWEAEFDALVARERELMVAVVDASRTMHRTADHRGIVDSGALAAFGSAHREWQEAVQAIDRFMEEYCTAGQ